MTHDKLNIVSFYQEYTFYLLQVFRQFISFRTFGPSGNKQSENLQQIKLYIPSKTHDIGCLLRIEHGVRRLDIMIAPKMDFGSIFTISRQKDYVISINQQR